VAAKPTSASAPIARAPVPALESANNNSGKKKNVDVASSRQPPVPLRWPVQIDLLRDHRNRQVPRARA
jgi:hypothetical protein